MRKILLSMIIISIVIFIVSGCINVNPISYSEQSYETMIQYAATLYNKGQYLSKDTVISYLNNPSYLYPREVVGYYRYFMGIDPSLPTFTTDKSISTEDKAKLDDYIKNFTMSYWQENDPYISNITYKVESYPNYTSLVKKVKDIMTKPTNKFMEDVNEYYPDFTTVDASNLAKFIVDTAIKVSKSNLIFSRKYDDKVFEKTVQIRSDYVKPELLLAFAMAETSFEPFAYKAEVNKDNKIYAISLGLSQILVDINKINNQIGLTDVATPDRYTFEMLNEEYFSSKYEANELFKIQTAELFKGVFLQLLFDRIIREGWIG